MKPRILFIEDEPEFFAQFTKAIRARYELVQVEDLTEAVNILGQSDFSLVIVDIMLDIGISKFPNVDDRRAGLYLIRLIRSRGSERRIALKCRSDVPLLAITAVSDLSLEKKLLELE